MSNHDEKEEPVYTMQEIAKRLRVSRQLIHTEIQRGNLDAYRIGTAVRIPQHSLDTYLRKGKEDANPLIQHSTKKGA